MILHTLRYSVKLYSVAGRTLSRLAIELKIREVNYKDSEQVYLTKKSDNIEVGGESE